jgi:hypothetical protein
VSDGDAGSLPIPRASQTVKHHRAHRGQGSTVTRQLPVLPDLPSPRGLHLCSKRCDLADGVLSAGRGRPAGSPFGGLVLALLAVVAAECGACGLSLVGPGISRRLGGTREIPVEALFPQGRERFELGSSGWSRVLGIDAVGGAPHCDFTDKCCARVASRWCPDWLGVTLAGVVLDLVDEVGDELGPLCQILVPNGMIMELFWNAGKPRKRPCVGRCRFWEAPVQHSGHVSCGVEFTTRRRCL